MAQPTDPRNSHDTRDEPALDPGFVSEAMLALFSPRAHVQRLLEFEAALARTQARLGIIPSDSAAHIEAACNAAVFDAQALLRRGWELGTPLLPLLDLLKQHLPAQHAPFLHYRATSQDAIDTAHALALRAGLRELAQKVAAISGALRKLARELRHTPMLARTLLQPAQPSVWGVRVANWLAAFIGAAEELERAAGALPVQLGGPVGTLSELQGRGLQLSAALAEELDLRAPLLPWHSDRTPIAHALHATGLSVRAALKLANDLVLLAQNERSEVRMRAGGSSSMPHKQNPIDAIHAVAAGESCVRLCGTFVAGRTHELERAAGALQMEWLLLPLVFYTSGATLEALKTAVATLEITIVAAADSGIAQDDSAAALIDRVLEAATAQWGAEP